MSFNFNIKVRWGSTWKIKMGFDRPVTSKQNLDFWNEFYSKFKVCFWFQISWDFNFKCEFLKTRISFHSKTKVILYFVFEKFELRIKIFNVSQIFANQLFYFYHFTDVRRIRWSFFRNDPENCIAIPFWKLHNYLI